MDGDSSDFHDSDTEEEEMKETERIADTLREINCKSYTDDELEDYVNELRSLAHQCVEENKMLKSILRRNENDMVRREIELDHVLRMRYQERNLERIYVNLSLYCFHLEKLLYDECKPQASEILFAKKLRDEFHSSVSSDLEKSERSNGWF